MSDLRAKGVWLYWCGICLLAYACIAGTALAADCSQVDRVRAALVAPTGQAAGHVIHVRNYGPDACELCAEFAQPLIPSLEEGAGSPSGRSLPAAPPAGGTAGLWLQEPPHRPPISAG